MKLQLKCSNYNFPIHPPVTAEIFSTFNFLRAQTDESAKNAIKIIWNDNRPLHAGANETLFIICYIKKWGTKCQK